MKNKDWKIPYARPCVPHALLKAGYPPLLCQVMALRGISTAEEAEMLLCGGEEELFDPMLITDMDRARSRVLRAIERKEIVSVYGDYDVDGITSTCLVTDYLKSKGLECHPYIPDRNDEGYGLNKSALKNLSEKGVSLLITVDCGITAVEEAKYAKELGIDMVITDHHECKPDSLPDVCALIDCKRPGDRYPNKDLSGVGVALKLVCACEGSSRKMLERYADLVAIGTIADVMPLVGENRFLVRYGLKRITEAPRPGIAAMLKESSVDIKKLNASTVGFSLAPRLNAAGRLGQTATAAKLIMSEDHDSAAALAHELCELNRKRQNIELEIWKEANELMRHHKPDGPIVLASDKWHQGVIGIAASRLAEQYSMPAIIICLNGDMGKGSCRSYGGFNLFEALSACSEHLLGFGGHALAAGLNIHREKLDDFRLALKEYYCSNMPSPTAEFKCDLLINDPALLSIENVRALDLLEPYGNANPKPLLCLSGVRVEALNEVGGGRHLRMRIRLGGSAFECIYFSHNAADSGIAEGDIIDLAFSPQINEFRGNISVQLVISAVRKHDPKALCAMILEGDESAEWAAAGYCPNRADFVKLWRSIPDNFTVGRDMGEILSQCLKGMEPEKYCLCLMTLKETGLLRSESGKIFSARCAQIIGKADLEGTRLIRSLRSYK